MMASSEVYRAVLADLRERQQRLAAAVAAIERLLDDGPPAIVADAPAVKDATSYGQRRHERPPRRVGAAEAQTVTVLDILREEGPLSPGKLAAAMKINPALLRARTRTLEARGAIELTGNRRSRIVRLRTGTSTSSGVASPQPPAEAPSQPKASSATPLEQVRERDRDVLARLERAGPTGRTLRELKVTTGEPESLLDQSLTRLKLKRQVKSDDAGRWSVANA